LAGDEGLFQVVKKQSAEQPRQNPDGQEEAGPAGNPSAAVQRYPAAGDKTVQMRMMQ
jgi:hypothetical protein